ncbi:MAG: MFS transporter [Marmoricola sp.]
MSRRELLTLAALSAGMFLVLLDVTVVNVALPDLGRSLGASLAGLQGVVDAYTVPLAALLLACGALVDRYGERRVLVLGIALFGAASLGCALSTDPATLIGLRAVQGVGAAALLPASQAGVARAFREPGRQARALGLWAGAASLALPAGPVLGGFLVRAWGWPAVFWLNVPVTVVLGAAVLWALPRPAHPGRSARVDVAGAVSGTVALGALVLAVIGAGRYGWSPGVVAGAVTGLVSTVVFLLVQGRAGSPLLPLSLLRSPRFVVANAVAGAMNFVGIGSILVLTLFLQSVQGRTSAAAGLALLPLFLPLVLLSPVAGRLVQRYGVAPPMLAGLLAGAAGSGLLVLVGPGSAYLRLVPVLLGLGVGMGLLTAAVVTAAVRAVPAARSGLAGGVTNAARQAGGAMGVAVYGALVGSPRAPGFVPGLHLTGALGGAAWLLAAAATVLVLAPRRASARRGDPAHTGVGVEP